MVKKIKSEAELNSEFEAAGDKLVVIDCFAEWCGPCKRIAPFVEQLSKEMPNVVFLKMDVDEADALAGKLGVTAMPTFFFYKNGKKVGDMCGANNEKLKQLVQQHSA
ncbi:Thioredoxin [Balamuthia mandrillaris]